MAIWLWILWNFWNGKLISWLWIWGVWKSCFQHFKWRPKVDLFWKAKMFQNFPQIFFQDKVNFQACPRGGPTLPLVWWACPKGIYTFQAFQLLDISKSWKACAKGICLKSWKAFAKAVPKNLNRFWRWTFFWKLKEKYLTSFETFFKKFEQSNTTTITTITMLKARWNEHKKECANK